jgi:hypothetical protein
MTFKIYYQRVFTTPPSNINLTLVSQSQAPSLPITVYENGNIPIFGFSLVEDPEEIHVLAMMLMPAYFEETEGEEIHGLFLFPIGKRGKAEEFLKDFGTGAFGCPKPIRMPGTEGYFSFNRQRFYPFLMTDFTVGYYVRDEVPQGGEAPEWPKPSDEGDLVEIGVSIDHPITFDPTLGLYMTRGAHIAFKPRTSQDL